MRLSSSRITALTHRPQQDFPLWDKAGTRPSLDLQFSDRKDLVDATTGSNLVDFTRASSGTYVGSDGLIKTATTNEARFDHDPETGESLGLLVEESRTNILEYSEDFTDPYWGTTAVNGTLTPDQAAAPDGTITATLYTENIDTSNRYFAKNISFTSGTFYTLSIWAKQASGTRYLGLVATQAAFGSNCIASFTLSGSGSYNISSSGTGTTANIQQFSNGWYRCSLTSQATVTTSSFIQFRLSDSPTNGTSSYTGDGTSGIYLWGAQLEGGSFPTSYIPTEGSTVTRAADVATDATTGANIRTLYAQFRSPASGTRPIASLDDNTVNERIELLTSGTDPKLLVTDGGSAVADLDAGAVVAGTSAKLATRFATDDYAAVVNGGTIQTDTAGTLPTVNRLRVGSDQAGNYFSGTIARLTGWNTGLPDSTLETITQ